MLAMRFRFWRTAIVLFLGVAAGVAATLLLRPPSATTSQPTLAETSLDRILPEVSLTNVPLNVAADRISELSGVPILIDRKDLPGNGLSSTQPVTIHLRNASLATVLDALVSEAVSPYGKLNWWVERDHIRLSGPNGAIPTVVRVYDVRDILETAKRPSGEPNFVQLFGVRRQHSLPTTEIPPEEDLEFLITQVVAPDTWRNTGGSVAFIRTVAGRMVVDQTVQNHREIQRLLAQIRETVKAPLPISSATRAANPNSSRWQEDVKQWVPDDTDAAEARLRERRAEFRVDHKPLPEVIEAFSKTWNIPAAVSGSIKQVVDGPKLSLALRNATGYETLRAILGSPEILEASIIPSSNGQPMVSSPYYWTLEGGLVRVELRSSSNPPQTVRRLYDVRDMLMVPPGANGSTIQPDQAAELLEAYLLDSLIDWRAFASGGIRVVHIVNGFVMVTESYENQERIRLALEEIRASARPFPATRPAGRPTTQTP
jgi:hypothetical protein